MEKAPMIGAFFVAAGFDSNRMKAHCPYFMGIICILRSHHIFGQWPSRWAQRSL